MTGYLRCSKDIKPEIGDISSNIMWMTGNTVNKDLSLYKLGKPLPVPYVRHAENTRLLTSLEIDYAQTLSARPLPGGTDREKYQFRFSNLKKFF
jgi:hypothetical protein